MSETTAETRVIGIVLFPDAEDFVGARPIEFFRVGE